MRTTRDPRERFWPKVDVRSPEECWIWRGSLAGKGYGHLLFSKGRFVYAHRLAYELVIGPIPEGLQLDHLCRTPSCVNPAHLEPVTPRENSLRGDHRTNNPNRLKTHCKHGHPFSDENTYVDSLGYRHCRICVQRNHRVHRKKKAAVAP